MYMPASPMVSPERLPATSAGEWVLVLAAMGDALNSTSWIAAPVGAHPDSSSRKGMEDCYCDIRLALQQLDGFLTRR